MKKVNAELFTDLKEFLKDCDVVTINVPLSDKTKGMFDAETIKSMKDGAYLVNNARGAIVNPKAVSGWSPQNDLKLTGKVVVVTSQCAHDVLQLLTLFLLNSRSQQSDLPSWLRKLQC